MNKSVIKKGSKYGKLIVIRFDHMNKNHRQCCLFKCDCGKEKVICFENFYRDMEERPEGKSLDRIDNNGNYCKENCRWSSQKEQMNNTRVNHLLTYNGKTQTVSQWAEEVEINCHTLFTRLRRGWTIKRALNF